MDLHIGVCYCRGMQYKPLPAAVRIGRLQAHILDYLRSRDLLAKPTEIAAALGGTLHRNTVPSAVRRLRERGLVWACAGHLQGSYRITPAGAAALKKWQQANDPAQVYDATTWADSLDEAEAASEGAAKWWRAAEYLAEAETEPDEAVKGLAYLAEAARRAEAETDPHESEIDAKLAQFQAAELLAKAETDPYLAVKGLANMYLLEASARVKVEISASRWRAIVNAAQRNGLPAQVVLNRLLDYGLEMQVVENDGDPADYHDGGDDGDDDTKYFIEDEISRRAEAEADAGFPY